MATYQGVDLDLDPIAQSSYLASSQGQSDLVISEIGLGRPENSKTICHYHLPLTKGDFAHVLIQPPVFLLQSTDLVK